MSLSFGILGLLTEESLHGYGIKSRFERTLGGTWEVNIGQVYQTLQRLERDGLIEAGHSRGDRNRLSYRATTAGRAAFLDWLEHPDEEPQELREAIYLKLLLASRLGDGRRERLLAGQRRVHLQRLHDLADLEARATEQRRDELVLLFRGALLHVEADLKWIDECLAAWRGGNAGGK